MRACLPAATAILAACTLLGRAQAQSGGIEVFAAETLFADGTRISLTHLLRERDDLRSGSDAAANPLELSRSDQRSVLGIDHGLRRDLTLSALVPFVWRELDSISGRVDAEGLGDVALMAKYRLMRRDRRRGSLSVALIGGLELPTGETGARQGGVLLPPGLQPGSGSWDPFLSLATTLDDDLWRYDAHVFYKWNTEGEQDHRAGDFATLDASVAYRFLHTLYPGPTASARLGLQWRHADGDVLSGTLQPNSGASALVLRPGLGWHPTPGTDVSLSADLPLYEDVEGTQLGLGTRLVLALGVRF